MKKKHEIMSNTHYYKHTKILMSTLLLECATLPIVKSEKPSDKMSEMTYARKYGIFAA